MRRLAALLPFSFVACGGSAVVSSSPAPMPAPARVAAACAPAAASLPVECELRRDLFVFASDSFGGRDAVLPSSVKAASFLAARAAALGLEPAGDSGFFQRVPMSWEMIAPTSSFTVGATPLTLVRDLVPVLQLGPGALTKLTADGDLVFGGYGVTEAGAVTSFAGVDLTGKVLVFVNSAPIADSAKRAPFETLDGAGMRIGAALQRGAAAVILIPRGKLASDYPTIAAQLGGGNVTLQDAAATDAPRRFPMVFFASGKASSLLPAGFPENMALRPVGRRFAARVDVSTRKVTGYNVVGIVRGSDARLNKSYVAFGAHLDHIGIQPAVNGDSIANGADDDGSGSVTLLAIARSFQQMATKPRRSILFVWHTGEEKGLLGSSWFTDHPTVPLDSVVAQINADMIGRNQPDSLYLIGPLAAPKGQSKVLGAIVDSVNMASAWRFKINREWDSPTHPEHFYERSDHFNYAKHGVPIVFFTSGDHPDYHKVSDEPSKIDYAKMSYVAALMYNTGLAVANRATRPLPGLVP